MKNHNPLPKLIGLCTLAAVALFAGAANAAVILDVDFQSLAVGPVSKPALDAATTGGTWLLDGTSSHSIEFDNSGNGDQAFLSSHTAAATGARVSLDTAVDIDADLAAGDLMIDFTTGTRDSTGFTRDAFWRLLDDGGSTLVTIEMDDGNVLLNGSNIGQLSEANDDRSVRPWDSTDIDVFTVAIKIDSLGGVDLTMTDNRAPVTLVNGSTSIAATSLFQSIETSWAFARANPANGIYLNDITITTPSVETPTPSVIPEPSTFLLAAIGLLGLSFLGRRPRRPRA